MDRRAAKRAKGGADAAAALFAGPGEVRALARTLDWGTTPLGWPDRWSPALRIATRAMLDAPHPICLWSGPEFALVYNDAYRRILAAKHPAALGQPGSIVWAEIWAELAAQFAQVWSGGPAVYGEDARFVMARLEGGETEDAWFSYSLSALRDEAGEIVAVLNISPETTARVRAEQAADAANRRLAFLAQASERLASSLDYETTIGEILALAVPTVADWAIYSVDAGDGTIRVVGSRHVDREREAFIAENVRRYPIRADEPAGAARVLRTGEPELIPEVPDALLEAVARDADHLRILRAVGFRSLMTVPVRAQSGTLGALGFVTGASGRLYGPEDLAFAQELARRAATALERTRLFESAQAARLEAESQRAKAEAANAAKSQFLSTMSHELRTPLNAIGGYTQLLTMGLRGPLIEAQRQDLERIRLANQHLMSLVTDILNFARVDAGQIEFHPADVELATVVGDLESLLGPQLRAKEIAFSHDGCAPDTPDQPHLVRADPEKLRQILLNLLGNAVKFTEPGGRIAIRCETDVGAGVIRVRVRDTGRGIPADQLDRIFEPFVQVDRHRTHESQQGVGLGLAISRELARGMGGDLSAESVVEVGSTFTLTLPRA